MKLLLSQLLDSFKGRPALKRILNNIGWTFAEKIFRVLIGLGVSFWFARYLGPEQFGQFSYAIAFVSLASALASLGLKDIAIRELVQFPERAPATMGSSIFLLTVGGIIAWFITLAITTLAYNDNQIILCLITLVSLPLLFNARGAINYWFESEVNVRNIIWIESVLFFISSLLKVALIVEEASLISFAVLLACEALLTTICLTILYRKTSSSPKTLQVNKPSLTKLLSASWPMMISSISVVIYMRVDQIMISQLLNDSAVGLYSASLRISEFWHVIPVIVCSSVFPAILRSKKNDNMLYQKRIQNLLNFLATLAILIAVFITFTADWIIITAFGKDYTGASSVLKIHIWAGVFVFVGVAGGRWYLAENLQYLTMIRTSVACILNIILNYIMIPKYGISGAATATLASMALSGYILDLATTKTRSLFLAKTKSFLFIPYFIIEQLQTVVRKKWGKD